MDRKSIDDDLPDFLEMVQDKTLGRGLVRRDWKKKPSGCLAFAQTFPQSMLVPRDEAHRRVQEQIADNSDLFSLRKKHHDVLKSLDQDGVGYCWAFSSTKAIMYLKARDGEPMRFCAWFVGANVKGYVDEGGNGIESIDWIASKGVPVEGMRPDEIGRRRDDTQEVFDNAALHKFQSWWDGTDSTDQNEQILISAGAMGLPCVLDYDDISHSMCGYVRSVNPLEVWCDNSWGDATDYGPDGIYVRKGRTAIPDGIWVPYRATGSEA